MASLFSAGRACALLVLGSLAPLGMGQPATPALPQVYLDTTLAPPTGTTLQVNAGDDLQQALDRANPGDEIVLQAGATFTGNFVLPHKSSGSAWITVRGSKMDALPPAGSRVHPADAANMPRIVTSNADPAVKTQPGAHHYRLMGLEIAVAPRTKLNYSTVFLGDGATLDALPGDIILDRVYIHGAVLCHCKQGVILNSKRTAVIDSYIAEYHSVDQDTQAILGYNGPGPFKIVNNYLEGSGENIMFGGAQAAIANLVPSDIEFRRNYLAKPLRWNASIIPKPQSVTAAAVAGGALGPGTYYYTVAAGGPVDYLADAVSDPADAVVVSLGGGMNSVALSWPAVGYGDSSDSRTTSHYLVYRTADPPGGARKWVHFDAPAAGTPSFTDVGDAGSPGGPAAGRRWVVKNLFEIKNAQRVEVDANVMEYNWQQAQTGTAILLLPRIEGGKMPWAVSQDLTFTNNLVRHAGGGATLGGTDDACAPASGCVQSSRVVFRNNIFQDVSGKKWGGKGWAFYMLRTDHVTLDHNTVINDGSVSFRLDGTNTNLAITNNIAAGDLSGDGAGGKDAVRLYAPGALVGSNVLVGGLSRYYDKAWNTAFPAKFGDVGFMNLAGGDVRLGKDSPYRKSAADGSAAGGDLGQTLSAIAGVAAGIPSGSAAAPSVREVLNAASGQASAAPGSLVIISGDALAVATAAAKATPLDVTGVADSSVSINGVPAPVVSVAPGLIIAQVPFEVAPGPASTVVSIAGSASPPFPFHVSAAAPGLYLADAIRGLVFNPDGTLNGSAHPAAAATFVTAYLTGQGAVSPAVNTAAAASAQPLSIPVLPVSASIGGVDAPVLFAGLTPEAVGVFQVSMRVPTLAPGDYPLVVTVGGNASNPALISLY